eukprot:520290_1
MNKAKAELNKAKKEKHNKDTNAVNDAKDELKKKPIALQIAELKYAYYEYLKKKKNVKNFCDILTKKAKEEQLKKWVAVKSEEEQMKKAKSQLENLMKQKANKDQEDVKEHILEATEEETTE